MPTYNEALQEHLREALRSIQQNGGLYYSDLVIPDHIRGVKFDGIWLDEMIDKKPKDYKNYGLKKSKANLLP